MPDPLNPQIDLAAAAERYKAVGRVQIPHILRPDLAEPVLQDMDALPWCFAVREGERNALYSVSDWQGLAPQQKNGIIQAANQNARWGFQYAFEYFGLMDALADSRVPGLELPALARFITSDAFAALGRAVTGYSDIKRADAQAVRYRPGHFLTTHDDIDQPNRRAAYVLNLTRDWRPDWGGLLNFFCDDMNVEEAWIPRFNTLNIFTVPTRHAVSYVAPCAGAPRLSITGWFLSA